MSLEQDNVKHYHSTYVKIQSKTSSNTFILSKWLLPDVYYYFTCLIKHWANLNSASNYKLNSRLKSSVTKQLHGAAFITDSLLTQEH